MNKRPKNPDSEIQFESVKSWFSSPLDLKIYIFLSIISLILLFYSIWEIKFVVVDLTDFLGLTSRLTLAYWIGYIMIIFCSIRLYLDKEYENGLIYILILMIFGLFLFGVPVFAEENARFPWSYHPAGEVKTVLETKYIDSISDYPLMSYRSWPATHMISASILYLTGIKIENLLKYMPLFWLFSVIFITFSIGKRFELSANQSFLASFFVLPSFWIFHYYYGPQSFAYVLYILSFMLITTMMKGNSIRSTILILLTFTTLVITHLLTSLAFLSSFVISSSFIRLIYKKRVKYIILFLIIFIAWYTYLAPVMFKAGVKEFIKQATEVEFFSFFKTEKYSAGELLTREITHYTRLFYLGIYAISMIIAAALYLAGRIKEEKKEHIKICFSWFVGILALFVFKYGTNEIEDRIYMFSLVPMAIIIILTFNRKTLIVLAILLVVPHIPAHYGSEFNDMARTTELKGAEFFAMKIPGYEKSYSYRFSPYVLFYDPEKIEMPWTAFKADYLPNISRLDNITYIVNSEQNYNEMVYSYGFDPVQEWTQLNQNNLILLYDNGYFNIYNNMNG